MTDESCVLVYTINGKNENGFPVETRKTTEVCCREKSVTRTEFYNAHREGFSVSLVLEVRQEDWELTKHMANGKRAYATKVLYDGGEYDIVRAYRNDKSMIQLMCG